jgi:DNA-directed RNA polymerase subunit RPC12/RpoP
MTRQEKIKIARDNVEPGKSFTVDGVKYAVCIKCRKEWNVPRWFDRQIRDGYVCPTCEGRLKREEASEQYS